MQIAGKITLYVLIAGGIAIASGAFAADMPVKARPPVYTVAPFSWTGCYGGASGGYTRSHDSSTSITGDPATTLSQTLGNVPYFLSPDGDGWLVGGQIGCNYQSGSFVWGVETDLSYVDAKSDGSRTQGPAVVTTRFERDLEFFGTVRGRFGWAFDRSLIYATGGLAYGKVDAKAIIFPNAVVGPILSGSDDDIRIGWTIGAGWEFAIDNRWSWKIEYLYYDLGSETLNIATIAGGAAQTAAFHYDTRGSIVRAGVNFRF